MCIGKHWGLSIAIMITVSGFLYLPHSCKPLIFLSTICYKVMEGQRSDWVTRMTERKQCEKWVLSKQVTVCFSTILQASYTFVEGDKWETLKYIFKNGHLKNRK